jgi:uncharacterized protein YraI
MSQSQIKITSTNLNLRSNPWISDNLVCVIPKTTMLSVDYANQEYNNWIKINYIGKIGFVYSKYLLNPPYKSNLSNNYTFNNPNSPVKYYTNSKGTKVQSPTYYRNQPAGATAECRDGTYSFSRNRRGTCSHHGGVKRWM